MPSAASKLAASFAPTDKIEIVLTEAGYAALYSGPHAKRIGDLFDTCTLPTPFTARAPLAHVVAEIQKRNPGVHVFHQSIVRVGGAR